jgi:hypothetical protein
MAQALHAEHVREFLWMAGDHLSEPMTVDQCGNCQRWARYAANLPTEVMLAALKARGVEVMRVRDSKRVIQYAGDDVPDV